MIVQEPAQRQHVRRIRTMEPVEWSLDHFDRNGIEAYLATFGRTLRLGQGGPIIAVVGLQIPKAGVAEAWALIDRAAGGHGYALVVELRKLIDVAFRELALWRMQAIARPDWAIGKRFLQLCGFDYEATLRCFLKPDLDGQMFVRIQK